MQEARALHVERGPPAPGSWEVNPARKGGGRLEGLARRGEWWKTMDDAYEPEVMNGVAMSSTSAGVSVGLAASGKGSAALRTAT